MTAASQERIAYHNGEYLPESQVRVPFRDRGFIFGDAVFDTARTFRGRPFKLAEHVDRLFESLAYLRIDPKLSKAQLIAITEQVLERNKPLLGPDDDYWLTQRVSRGSIARGGGDQSVDDQPTVIVECQPLPLKARARLYVDGIKMVVPSLRRTPPSAVSPRAKTNNYLNLVLADLEVRGLDPDAWAVMLDVNGNLTEGLGSNIFVVRDGKLLTPRAQMVLPGVTRATVMELAAAAGVAVEETDIDMYDALTAKEAFLTSTSLCICPVTSIDGRKVADGRTGPVTEKLMQAFRELVQFDYVAQYRAHLQAA
jgi:branched-chain amino acid aminotransferase